MRSLCHILQLNFPEALEKLVIFPTSWMLNALWMIVRPFLDRSVVERVVLLSESDFRSYLSTIIPKEGLPRAYGGAAPDDSPVEGFCSPDRSPNPISGDERRDPAGEISIEAPLGSKPPCRDDISVAAHALSQ